MNKTPHEAPAAEPIQAAHKSRTWQRVLAIAVPACAGAAIMTAIESGIRGNWLLAVCFFLLGLAMLAPAWSLTR